LSVAEFIPFRHRLDLARFFLENFNFVYTRQLIVLRAKRLFFWS